MLSKSFQILNTNLRNYSILTFLNTKIVISRFTIFCLLSPSLFFHFNSLCYFFCIGWHGSLWLLQHYWGITTCVGQPRLMSLVWVMALSFQSEMLLSPWVLICWPIQSPMMIQRRIISLTVVLTTSWRMWLLQCLRWHPNWP